MAITGTRLACALAETKALTLTAASPGVVAGTMAKVEDVVGFYFKAADTGDSVAFIYYAPKVVVPCAAAASGSYAVGSKVYFDANEAKVNETVTGGTLCGVVLEQPATSAEEVLIALDGTLGIVS